VGKKTAYVPAKSILHFPFTALFTTITARHTRQSSAGYLVTEKQAQVEVNVYSTAKPEGELVWTTNIFEGNSTMKVNKQLVWSQRSWKR
jgi:hypothetical protein